MVKIPLVDFVKGKIKNIEKEIERKSPTEGKENQLLVKRDSKNNNWVEFGELIINLKSTYTQENRLLIATVRDTNLYATIIGSLKNLNGGVDIYIEGNKLNSNDYNYNRENGDIQFIVDVNNKYNKENDNSIIEIYNSCNESSKLCFLTTSNGLIADTVEIDTICIDYSSDDKSFFKSASQLKSIKNIIFGANIDPLTTCSEAFASCGSLTSIKSIKTIVAPINISKMFKDCDSLTEVPLFDTSKATDMNSMFFGCSNLIRVPLFDTSKATDMNSMFRNCYNLTEVPLFNTGEVTNMSYIFSGCNNLTEVPLFNTGEVTNMSYIFSGCNNLTEVPLFNTGEVTDMSYMFSSCTYLTKVPLFDTSKVSNMSYMFNGCRSLTEIPLFDTSSVSNMNSMFKGCDKLIKIPTFNASNTEDMRDMFYNCEKLTEVSELNTSNTTNMNSMFYGCENLEKISKLDVSSVNNCNYIFESCHKLLYIKLISTSLDKLQNIINKLPEHIPKPNAYIIDLSECTIDVSSITAPTGWTIKLQN